MLRILGRTNSINVRKVLWTAAECGLDYTHEPEWAAERSVRDPEFLALNPHGLVPVLVDGDVVLSESHTICRYLAAVAGREDLLPHAPVARAGVEKWMDWQQTDLNSSWSAAFYALVRKVPAAMSDTNAIANSARAWNEQMALLERQIASTGAYAAGETFTLADIPLGLSVQRWRLTPIGHDHAPRLDEYRAKLLARPAVQKTLDPLTP